MSETGGWTFGASSSSAKLDWATIGVPEQQQQQQTSAANPSEFSLSVTVVATSSAPSTSSEPAIPIPEFSFGSFGSALESKKPPAPPDLATTLPLTQTQVRGSGPHTSGGGMASLFETKAQPKPVQDEKETGISLRGTAGAIYRSKKSWEDLKLPGPLTQAVYAMGFTSPAKVQAETLPFLLTNKQNLIVKAQTGSGKTGAYALAMLAAVDQTKQACQGLVIVPTRELAIQVYDAFVLFAHFTQIKIAKAIPDEPRGPVRSHVVVGTPGTLIAKLKHGELDPSTIIMFVADEADQMLSRQGLGDQTMQVKIKCKNPALRTLLFSATFNPVVMKFATVVAPQAKEITIEKEQLNLDGVKQFVVNTQTPEGRYQTLATIYAFLKGGQVMVFANDIKTAKEVTNQLRAGGYSTSLLFGKNMDAKGRDAVMNDFRTGKTTLMVTTNVIARGIDVPATIAVVNYDVPMDQKGRADRDGFVHRSGRAGRYGRAGMCITFFHDEKSKQAMQDLQKHFELKIEELPTADLEVLEKKIAGALVPKG